MDALFDVRRGSLYYSDTTLLSEVGYKRVSATTAYFFFEEEPDITYPLEVVFRTVGEQYDDVSFACTLTGCKEITDEQEKDCYRVTGTVKGLPEFRDDVRINVTFPVEIELEDGRTIEAQVKDMSAGGFRFVSEEDVPEGMGVSFLFTLGKLPVFITGDIKHQYPSGEGGLKSYGCQFVNLPPTTESVVRNFVFHEEVVRRKRKVTVW